MSDAVLQALESSDDTAGIWLWRSVSAELAGPLRIGIVGRDERLVQRVGAHLPENTSWTPIVVGSEPDPALPVQDRLLPLHAVVFATPSTAPLGASEREWLGHLGALGAPSERVVAIGDLNVLAAMSDAPEQEAREIAARVDALTPRDWRVVDEDTLPAAVIDWRARLDTVARSRRAEVGRVLLRDAVRRASDAVQRAERELAAVDALLGAEDAAIDEAARLGGRTAAHLSSAARRQTEQLQVDLAAFLTALEGDIAAQLDGVQDIDLARRALPHWLHHVVEGWMSDRVARWRADLEAELADLGIAAEDLDRADLVAPALHARIPHATQGWGKRLGVTAAMGGGAALLAFGLWIPGLLAVSGGALFSALGRKAEEAATRRALGEAAVDAIRKMGADADRLLRDQVQGFQATLATLSDERRHTESEARALVRGHLAEEHAHHGRRIDALRVTRDRLRAALDGLTPAGRP